MTVSSAAPILRVADVVDQFWGSRVRNKNLASVSEWYRVVVYDAFVVRFTMRGDLVEIDVEAAAPEPAQLETLRVSTDQVPEAIGRIDEEFRSRLPAGYLARYEEALAHQESVRTATSGQISPQERRALLGDDREPVAAEAEVALEDVPDILVAHLGDRVKVAAPRDSSVEAVLDNILPFSITRDGQHGVYTAGVWFGDQAIVSLLGKRLIARHQDARSIAELVDVIDEWLTARRAG